MAPRHAKVVNLLVFLAVTPDRQLETVREGVDDRDPDTMQATRDLVGIVIEFAARVQHGHDDLGGRHPFFRMNTDRNAATIVSNADRIVRVNGDADLAAVPRQGFIDRIVDDLEHHVVQPCAVVGVADIHTGPLTNRIQAFQDFDRGCVVTRRRRI